MAAASSHIQLAAICIESHVPRTLANGDVLNPFEGVGAHNRDVGVTTVGGVHKSAIRGHGHARGALAHRQLADHFELFHVNGHQQTVRFHRDKSFAAIGGEGNATRTQTDFDGTNLFAFLNVQDVNLVRLFGRHQHEFAVWAEDAMLGVFAVHGNGEQHLHGFDADKADAVVALIGHAQQVALGRAVHRLG